MPDAFTQAIHDCAMETEDNLIVFVRVGRSFPEFEKKLVCSFVNKLEENLKLKFPESNGWEIYKRTLITEPFKNYSELSIRNSSWPLTLRAKIEAERSCTDIAYGVGNSEHTDEDLMNLIFNTMQNNYREGCKYPPSWPFCIQRSKFSNWSEEIAITSMRQAIKGEQPAEILDFFYNELVTIVEALKNCINEWNRRNPNS